MAFTSTLIYFHTKLGKGPRNGNLPACVCQGVNPNQIMVVGRSPITDLCVPRTLVPGDTTPSEIVLTSGMECGKSCCTISVCYAELRMHMPFHGQAPCLPAQAEKCGLWMNQSHTGRIRLFQTSGKYKKPGAEQRMSLCIFQ